MDMEFDLEGRLARLRSRMEAGSIDAFLALRSTNVSYLSGFDDISDSEDPHAVLVTAEAARFVTDSRYLEIVQKQVPVSGGLWQVDSCAKKWIPEQLHEIWDLAPFRCIAVEDSVSQRVFSGLTEKLAPAKLVATKDWIEDLRRSKDEGELARIARAQEITDQTFSHICGFIAVGLTEKEIARELEYHLVGLGADAPAFPSIVASGPNGSLPHAVPGERKLSPGDFVTLDFGAAYKGYCSDMTRTVCVGAVPDDEQRRVYDAVLKAQLASLDALRPKARGIDVDKAGRELITTAGYGENFEHGTSHGVGLEIHEAPSASPRSSDTLEVGDVVSCEPGIYLPGKLGVRIEDLVAIVAEGAHNFTTSPKQLLVL